MKTKILFGTVLAFAMTAFLLTVTLSNPATVEAEAAPAVAMMDMSCPNSPATIQGCIIDVDGCTYVNTINGRLIAVHLGAVSVGVGDNASLTGNFIIDQDCNPCVLFATSATDLGDC